MRPPKDDHCAFCTKPFRSIDGTKTCSLGCHEALVRARVKIRDERRKKKAAAQK